MILGYSFTCSILSFALFLNIKLMLSVKFQEIQNTIL